MRSLSVATPEHAYGLEELVPFPVVMTQSSRNHRVVDVAAFSEASQRSCVAISSGSALMTCSRCSDRKPWWGLR
jgi:hypothetical protein